MGRGGHLCVDPRGGQSMKPERVRIGEYRSSSCRYSPRLLSSERRNSQPRAALPQERGMQQRYMLTIHDLFTVCDGVHCGGETFVAILDADVAIDRLRFA